jgi:hypothetical protein
MTDDKMLELATRTIPSSITSTRALLEALEADTEAESHNMERYAGVDRGSIFNIPSRYTVSSPTIVTGYNSETHSTNFDYLISNNSINSISSTTNSFIAANTDTLTFSNSSGSSIAIDDIIELKNENEALRLRLEQLERQVSILLDHNRPNKINLRRQCDETH